VEAAPEEAKIIRQARETNDAMPYHVLTLVQKALPTATPDTYTIAVFGLTFKADIDDVRESPALHIAQMLVRAGYNVRTYDPHVVEHETMSGAVTRSASAALDGADLLLILVDHSEFKKLAPEDAAGMANKRVIDTRNILDAPKWREAGFEIRLLGAP
jgi:UDP-N-acetyl-D-mannosaminuronic acid dehydrogenase